MAIERFGRLSRRGPAAAGYTLAVLALTPGEAMAHAADRGHVLLLPTGHYLVGGAAAVILTFILLAFAPLPALDRLARQRVPLGSVPVWPRLLGSAACLLLVCALVAAGFLGSRDPLSNPLPLMVWTVFWVGLTLVQGVTGNFWWWIDPWYAPSRALAAATGREHGFVALPAWLGYWPAVVLFFAFAWFELIYPAPDDPERLAVALIGYFLTNLAAMLVFGHEQWSRRGECLSVFMRMIARLGVVESGPTADGRQGVVLCLPGAKLVNAEPLPPSGMLFLLLALGSVSFDGLMRTFFWLGLFGINPLEFPGRSAVTGLGTFGLVATFAVLALGFFSAVGLGERLAGAAGTMLPAAGALVWSIIPIAMAYHFSHYLAALVVNGQYALAALSDPLMNGADLFGTAGLHVQAGVLMGAERAWMLWNLQAGAIIGGHVLAVLVAHTIAFRLHGSARAAARSQAPLAVLMVAYTVFGLWLLSSPAGA